MMRFVSMTLASVMAMAVLATPAPADAQSRGKAKKDKQVAGRIPSEPINPVVGGAEMYPSYTILQNATNSAEHTTLVKAVAAGGLAAELSAPGPYTVFAPTDEAFGRLAPGMVDTLLQPQHQATLQKVLKYHVVAGRVSTFDLQARIEAGGGSATLVTADGGTLTATQVNGVVALTDVNGNTSYVTYADVDQANGMLHVVNGVLLPKLN